MSLINLDSAPTDPIPRLVWLSGVKEQVARELDAEFRTIYFQARQRRQFDAALAVGMHSKKVALAYTRAENRRLGTRVRWSDRIDSTSTAFYSHPTD